MNPNEENDALLIEDEAGAFIFVDGEWIEVNKLTGELEGQVTIH